MIDILKKVGGFGYKDMHREDDTERHKGKMALLQAKERGLA